jgi:hypothetical protein
LLLPSAFSSFHTIELLPQHIFECFIAPREQHDVVCIDGFAAGVAGEGFEVAGSVGWSTSVHATWGHGRYESVARNHTDLCIDQLGQSTDELGRRIQIVCEEGIVYELAD